jgi:hypothetical protein
MTVPKSLRREGAALYRRVVADVPVGMELDACERETVKRAAQLADLAAEVQADLERRGLWVLGSAGQDVMNPAVARLTTLHAAVATTLARVKLNPPQKTSHLSKRQRDQLAAARAQRWPAASA